MEGDVARIAKRPSPQASISADTTKKEQEKWDAWEHNAGISRTEAKRRYIEKLIDTMHKYASTTPEARELVEELEFVWDQIRNNSNHSSSENSSPLQTFERRDYMQHSSGSGNIDVNQDGGGGGVRNAAGLRVLAPVSQVDEDEILDEERDEEEFVDAPVSQIDPADLNDQSQPGDEDDGDAAASRFVPPPRSRQSSASPSDGRWRKRMEATLIKLTTEIAALREQLESRRYLNQRRKHSWLGWILRLSGWAVQLVVADAVILWLVILFMRRRKDPRLEGAVRVLLGDAVATMQSLGRDVKLSRIAGRKKE